MSRFGGGRVGIQSPIPPGTYGTTPDGNPATALVTSGVAQTKTGELFFAGSNRGIDIAAKGGQALAAFDNAAAVDAAQLALPAEGGDLRFGPGVWGMAGAATASYIVKRSYVKLKGSGMHQTTLRRISGTLPLIRTSGAFLSNKQLVVEDMTLDWNLRAGGVSAANRIVAELHGNALQRAIFRRVRFFDFPDWALWVNGVAGLEVDESCVFENPGTNKGIAIQLSTGSHGGLVRASKFRYCATGVTITAAGSETDRNRDISTGHRIEDNDMDLGWYTGIPLVSNSGGTVTYTATGLTDTAAAFSGLLTSGESAQLVRAMDALATGTATFPEYTSLADATKNFSTLGVKRGHLVRTSDGRFGIVAGVKSTDTTKLWVEEWLNDSDRLHASVPAANSTYTVYRPLIGRLTAFTGTTLTVNKWVDFDGALVTPSAGTLYEITDHSNYAIVGGYSTKYVKVKRNNLRRGYSDQITGFGEQWTIQDNNIEDGAVYACTTYGPRHKISGNTGFHNGGGGFFVGGNDTDLVGNTAIDNCWWNAGGNPELSGDFMLNGQRAKVKMNSAERVAATNGENGFVIVVQSTTLDGHEFVGNTSRGHTVAGLKFGSTALVTNTRLRDNNFVDGIVGTGTGTDYGVLEGTGTPEGAVSATIGTMYRRKDGGAGTTLYVKESGTGNTGWVAK